MAWLPPRPPPPRPAPKQTLIDFLTARPFTRRHRSNRSFLRAVFAGVAGTATGPHTAAAAKPDQTDSFFYSLLFMLDASPARPLSSYYPRGTG